MPYSGGVDSVHFTSHDAELVGIVYAAAGDGPRPAAILLHGIPGSERNVDIAYRLRDLGWHTLIPSFRGTWGSGGNYDMGKQPDDATAAIDFLLTTRADWQIDPAHLSLIGYSLGSRAAIVAAHRDARVSRVVSIAGIADFDELILSEEFYSNGSPFLCGSDPRSLKTQWNALGGAENPIQIIAGLQCPILIVHGDQDDVVPFYMASALHDATGKRADFVPIAGADHVFTHHRAELVKTVTDWLTHADQ